MYVFYIYIAFYFIFINNGSSEYSDLKAEGRGHEQFRSPLQLGRAF